MGSKVPGKLVKFGLQTLLFLLAFGLLFLDQPPAIDLPKLTEALRVTPIKLVQEVV